MSLGRAEIWILVASLGGAAWLFTRPEAPHAAREPERASGRRAPALSALPPGAQLLGRLDLARLRQSGLGATLTASGRDLSGLGRIAETCGFDPTEQVSELVMAVPPGTGEPALGIVATGDFEPASILDCAAKLIVKRGGEPSQSRIGEFSSVRDRSRSGAEVAVKPGGPILVGEGDYFRAMVDAADGRGPTLLGDQAHATLREAVGGYGALSVTFTARPGWLERYVPADEAENAPLGSVRAGALRVDLEPSPKATLLLSCPETRVCTELGKWADRTQKRARDGASVDPISHAEVSVEKNAMRLTLSFDPLKLQKLILGLFLDDARQ